MIKYLRNVFIAALGLTIVSAPLVASAAPTGYVRTSGGYHAGYAYHGSPGYGYYRPGYGYYRPGYGYPVAYVNGWYGYTPLGWYGYYWNGGWYQHRRWSGGIWIYF